MDHESFRILNYNVKNFLGPHWEKVLEFQARPWDSESAHIHSLSGRSPSLFIDWQLPVIFWCTWIAHHVKRASQTITLIVETIPWKFIKEAPHGRDCALFWLLCGTITIRHIGLDEAWVHT